MNVPARARQEARRSARLSAWRRKAADWAPMTVLVLCLVATVACFAWLCVAMHDNRTIARLASGHDIDVGAQASPAVTFARAKFFMDRDDFEQSQPLVEQVVHSGREDEATHVLYDAGNARLHHAISLIEDNKFDAAAADVVLARDFYTRALRIDPQFWDAKYNLDIAMRLVRDLPDVDIPGQDLKQPTSKLWTDLPGLPKGGP
jgi:mxaK protein